MRKLSIFLMVYLSAICLHTKETKAQTFAHQKAPVAAGDGGDVTGSGESKSATTDSTPGDAYDSTKRPIDMFATVYNNLPYLKDDNPAGFTQTYLEATFWRNPRDSGKYEVQMFKTFFLQAYFSTNVNAANTYDTGGSKPVGYLNKLDLYQHASSMINLHQDLLYFHHNKGTLWETQLFLDVMASYMRTNVSDSISKNTTNVDSWLLGANFSASFKSNKNIFNLPMSFLLTNEIFWINPMTNSFSPNLGFQYANRGDVNQSFNGNKNFLTDPHPYYHLDAQISFVISKQDVATKKKSTNKLLMHIGYVTGLNNNGSKDYYNSYFQAQIGLSLDLIGTINKYTGPKATSSDATTPKQ